VKFFPHRRAKALLIVPALVAATVAGVAITGRPAGAAAGGAWPIDTYGTPRTTDNVVLKWNEQLLSTIRAYPPQTGPTITARALGVLHTAIYDAWAAYDPVAKGTRPDGPPQQGSATPAAKDEAISYAAYRVLADLFPPDKFPSSAPKNYSTPDILLRAINAGYDPANTTLDPSTPAGVGNLAAKAVLDFRHADGSNQLNGYADTTGYQPVNQWNSVQDRWRWQPLCVLTAAGVAAKLPPTPAGDCVAPNYGVQKALTPQWPTVTSFGPLDARHYPPQFALPGPPKLADGNYSPADVDLALSDTSNLSDAAKVKAEYWADGPGSEFPPGHMAVFAQALSRMRGDTLDQDAKLFFALGNALMDASISSWASKYEYDLARPTTGIRERYRDQQITSWLGPGKGFGKVPGQNWLPYQALNVVTPPFPEYVSGHSTFTAAGRTVLNGFFGTDSFNAKVTVKAGSSKIEPGVTPTKDVVLSWKTLTATADEAGWSRRYGGIHYKSGDEHGRTLGKVLGYNAWIKAQAYFNGTATG
jgi:hypothetical protein